MSALKYLIFSLLLFTTVNNAYSQQAAAVDSMKRALAKVQTPEEKVYWMDVLSRTLMNVDLKEADNYGNQLIEIGEESRDRKLMIKCYISNGVRCSYFAGNKDYTQRSIDYYNKALTIARQNKLEEQEASVLLLLAHIHLAIPDKDKALTYAHQASSIIQGVKNDSLKTEVESKFGDIYLTRNDKILALRHYLTAMRLAEDTKNPSLMRSCNVDLAGFYSAIEDYDRAIDYYIKATKNLENIKEKNAPYQKAVDLNSIGNLHAKNKNHALAVTYFEKSLAMADSLKFSNLKIPAYISLLNEYLRNDKPKEALEYFNSARGRALQQFLNNFGMSGVIDQAYAVIYTELDKYDSAKYYFGKAAPFFENSANKFGQLNYYAQLATLKKKTGEYQEAIDLFLKVKQMAESTDQLETAERAAKHLDTLYVKLGNYQLASQYNGIYYQYKDSVEKLNKEKELTQVEAADEQLRQERLEKEKLEAKRKRFQIQYIAITIGIAAFFIALVMLGMFKVSKTTIRMIGFFTFIMFFEFIFLIFKKNIVSITDGEPWKDLLFMIGLAAVLLPLHHWMEHKVIHYLTSHNRLTEAGNQLKSRFLRRKKVSE